MSSTAAARLYTPEILALAVALADYPMAGEAGLIGEARSTTCGSTITISLGLSPAGAIAELGMRVSACAIGQAAAALFAKAAAGRTRADLDTVQAQLRDWLAGTAPMPNWPDLALLEPARAYPARHGAILLPWNATLAALSKTPEPS